MNSLKLHWISGSPNCWRVSLTLALKNIEFQSQRIDPATWDKQNYDFLKLNPRGKVPVLEDGNTIVYESIAIMVYLDSRYPELPIFGDNPSQTSLIWQRIAESIHYSLEPIYELSRLFMRKKIMDDINHSKRLVQTVAKELRIIDSQLEHSSHMAGNKLSAADLYSYPAIAFLERVLSKTLAHPLAIEFYPISEKLTNLSKWMDEIEKMPGFENAYPVHWRDQ